MPNTASSKKRLRQNIATRNRNRAVKSNVRKQIRKVHAAIESVDVEQSEAALRIASRELDCAAARKVFHPNKAARTKSRLAKAVRKLKEK